MKMIAPSGIGEYVLGSGQKLRITLDRSVDIPTNEVGRALLAGFTVVAPLRYSADVVVLGATPAGIAAAVAAARLGKKVYLISDSDRLGGVQGWGITNTDVAVGVTPAAVVGFAREYLDYVGKKETATKDFMRFHRVGCIGKPSWFARSFNYFVSKEGNISTVKNAAFVGCLKTGTRVKAVYLDVAGERVEVTGRVFIDATYTGDLIAAAGCSYTVGREANATYTETLNGIRSPGTWAGSVSLDPYRTPGDPGSGLLPGIDKDPAGTVGAADGKVMGAGFRLLVTTTAGNRVPFPAPDLSKYDPLNYELLARAMAAAPTSYDTVAELFQLYSLATGGYFDLNTRGNIPCSSNWHSDECLEYVSASPERRAVIRDNAKQYLLGLFYWITNSTDSRIPAGLKTDLASYGFSNEELLAYGGFSPEFYIREGRRLVGDYVMTENDMTINNGVLDTIAFGYYGIDSHLVRILVNGSGKAVPEGSGLTALTSTKIGFPIPYRVLVPKAAECTNVLSPGAPSWSRVVHCSARMEPIFLAIGEAAGIGASEAVEQDINVGDVSQVRLGRIQDIYRVWDGSLVLSADGVYPNGTVTVTGTWATVGPSSANARHGFLGTAGAGYSVTSFRTAAPGANKLKFQPLLWISGAYRVYIKYPPDTTGRANNATVNIVCEGAGGAATQQTFVRSVSELYAVAGGGGGGDWEDLGVYNFRAKGGGVISDDYVEVDATGASDVVAVAAVKFVLIP